MFAGRSITADSANLNILILKTIRSIDIYDTVTVVANIVTAIIIVIIIITRI